METKEMNLWEVMPAIALRGLTIFPNMIIHFDVSRQKSIIAVEQAMMQEQKLFLVAQRDVSVEELARLYFLSIDSIKKIVYGAPQSDARKKAQ